METMKIGMMADMYKPYISGVTNHIEVNTVALTKAGHQVLIFTFGDPNHQDTDETVIRSRGIPIKLPFADLSIQLVRDHSPKAIHLIQEMDIINVHHPFMSGNIANRYCHDKDIPVVFTSHTRYDLYSEIYLPFLPSKLTCRLMAKILQKCCQKFDAVITPSHSCRKMYDSLGIKANFLYIPNGISLDHIEATDQPFNREVLGINHDEILLMYLGRISPEKNLPFLIDTFHDLIQSRPNIRLVFVGKGTEYQHLERKVRHLGLENFIHFTGFVPHQEVPKYLLMADIFLTASTTEIHPLSVLEAMGAGLPIVGINASGVGDVVEHQYSGLLSKLDRFEICQNLTALIDDPERRKDIGAKAKEAAQQYNIENTQKQLISAFQELIHLKKAKSS
jgi:glycosyltransferase involved in cell wall biosynthesis